MSLVLAAVLLIVIGVSGLCVGLALLSATSRLRPEEGGSAFAIPIGMSLYALAALVGGVGLYSLRRWAHRLSLVVTLAGLSMLAWLTTLAGPDIVLLFGLGVWAVVLLLLLLPGVRAVVG